MGLCLYLTLYAGLLVYEQDLGLLIKKNEIGTIRWQITVKENVTLNGFQKITAILLENWGYFAYSM